MSRNLLWGAIWATVLSLAALGVRAQQAVVTCDVVRGIVRANPEKSLDQLAKMYHLNSSEVDLAMHCLNAPGPKANKLKVEKSHAPPRHRPATPVARPVPVNPNVGDTDGLDQRRTAATVSPEPAPLAAPRSPAVVDDGRVEKLGPPQPAPVTAPQHEGLRAMTMTFLLMIFTSIVAWEGGKLGMKGVISLFKRLAARAKAAAPADVLGSVQVDVAKLLTSHSTLAADLEVVKKGLGALDGEFHSRLLKVEQLLPKPELVSPQPATAAPTGPAAPAQ